MAIFTPELTQTLYVSTFARGLPTWLVPEIVATSRIINAERSVSGVLVFDGHRFAQYLEGPPATLATLIARIKIDLRHIDFTVLHSGRIESRRFARFAMGLATLGDDEDFLEKLMSMKGHAALKYFMAGLGDLDRTTASLMKLWETKRSRTAPHPIESNDWILETLPLPLLADGRLVKGPLARLSIRARRLWTALRTGKFFAT